MTIYSGVAFKGFVEHAFTGTLSNVIAAPSVATSKIIITAWSLRGTGAATAPVFQGTVSTSSVAAQPLAIDATWNSAPGTVLPLPAGDGLNITGGAASGVLNGYICFYYSGSVGATTSTPADLGE